MLALLHQMPAFVTSPSVLSTAHPPAGAIWELHELVRKAQGDRHNCEQLDLFCQDVMRVLDIAGAHLSEVDGLRLAKLLEHVEAGIELVDACSRSGGLGQRAEHVATAVGCPWPCEWGDADARQALQAAS